MIPRNRYELIRQVVEFYSVLSKQNKTRTEIVRAFVVQFSVQQPAAALFYEYVKRGIWSVHTPK